MPAPRPSGSLTRKFSEQGVALLRHILSRPRPYPRPPAHPPQACCLDHSSALSHLLEPSELHTKSSSPLYTSTLVPAGSRVVAVSAKVVRWLVLSSAHTRQQAWQAPSISMRGTRHLGTERGKP